MSNLYFRDSAIIPQTPGTDLTDKKGYLVTLAGGTATLSASATVPAKGVVLNGTLTAPSSIGILGALSGTVKLKAHGAITAGDYVAQFTDGTVKTDPGTGTARVVVGVACESAVDGELFEVATLTPQVLA